MDYRHKKQITISVVFVLILILIGMGFYFLLKPKPTCLDKIKNQGEEGTDCGGPCELCYPYSDIKVNWEKVIKKEDNKYDLVAKIENPNPNLGTENLNYKFELKNNAGQVVKSVESATFILPNSTRYIIEPNIESNEAIASVNLIPEKVEKSSWQQLKDYQSPDLFVKDKNVTTANQNNYFIEATGNLKNDTDFDFDAVDVNIVLFDINQEPIAVSKTQIKTLMTGEERYFSVKWYTPPKEEIKSYDMQPETNLFSSDNYMDKHGVPRIEP